MTEEQELYNFFENQTVWKQIPGYNYEMNGLRQVRNIKTQKIMKVSKDSYGKQKLNLSKNGIKKTHYIDKLYKSLFL